MKNKGKIKIIGLGSPHGDDQAGWHVIQQLQPHWPDSAPALLMLDRPGPALLNTLSDCDTAIIIDACDAGWPGGTIKQLTLAQLLDCAELQTESSHQLGVAATLQLAITVGYPLPAIECYLIQTETVTPLAAMTPAVMDAASQLAARFSATAECSN